MDTPEPQIMEEILERVQITPTGARAESHGQIVSVPTSPDSGGDCGDPVDSTGAHFRAHL